MKVGDGAAGTPGNGPVPPHQLYIDKKFEFTNNWEFESVAIRCPRGAVCGTSGGSIACYRDGIFKTEVPATL